MSSDVEPPFDLAKTRDFILTHGMSEEPRVYALVETVPDNVNAKSVIKKLGIRRESEPAAALEVWTLDRSGEQL